MPPLSTPEFWARRGLFSSLLLPIAWAYGAGAAARAAWTLPFRAAVPVICIGNLVAGGAGKTPVALSLAARVRARGHAVHILSRGYGGSLAGPLQVDRLRHRAAEVGDEPLLLAGTAPTWVARDRVAGAKAAVAAGASLLLLDDGLQNPHLAKSLSLLVVDGGVGFGNGRVLPAGPLRETLASGLARADAVVLMGDDDAGVTPRLRGKIVHRARLVAENGADFAGKDVIAFAGIGRPAKFFASLSATAARVIERHGFADHHRYREEELSRLEAQAAAAHASLVTTAKDWVRLPPAWQARIAVLRVAVDWDDAAALDSALERAAHG
jgi:tetraacyldisaccharide 4'-kinase